MLIRVTSCLKKFKNFSELSPANLVEEQGKHEWARTKRAHGTRCPFSRIIPQRRHFWGARPSRVLATMSRLRELPVKVRRREDARTRAGKLRPTRSPRRIRPAARRVCSRRDEGRVVSHPRLSAVALAKAKKKLKIIVDFTRDPCDKPPQSQIKNSENNPNKNPEPNPLRRTRLRPAAA